MKLTKLEELHYDIQLDNHAEEKKLLKLTKEPELMKAGEVCDILQISRMSLTNYVRAGLIEAVTLNGKSYRYKRSSVMKILNKD